MYVLVNGKPNEESKGRGNVTMTMHCGTDNASQAVLH